MPALNKPQGVKQIIEPKDESFKDESLLGAVSTLCPSSNTSTQAQIFNKNGQKSMLLALLRPYIEANGEDWLNLSRWHYLVVNYSLLSQSMKY